jgi:hypothetical protein
MLCLPNYFSLIDVFGLHLMGALGLVYSNFFFWLHVGFYFLISLQVRSDVFDPVCLSNYDFFVILVGFLGWLLHGTLIQPELGILSEIGYELLELASLKPE